MSRRQKNENYEKNKSEKKRKKKNLLRWRENFFSFGTHFQSTTFYDERMRREREKETFKRINSSRER